MNLALMLLIDKQFLEMPFYGVRQMTWPLRNEGRAVNVKRIRRLMRLMPIFQKPDTSRPAKGHKTYPICWAGCGSSWCADITYLPMRRGLVAIMDWFTRKVMTWRNSNTLEADFSVEALNEAIHRFGPPGIMNTDQGSQFTSFAWTDRLRRVGTRISMDGKGRWCRLAVDMGLSIDVGDEDIPTIHALDGRVSVLFPGHTPGKREARGSRLPVARRRRKCRFSKSTRRIRRWEMHCRGKTRIGSSQLGKGTTRTCPT